MATLEMRGFDKLIKRLDIIEKSLLPQAAEQALKSFGFDARELLQREMRSSYRTVTNYTLASPRFKQQGLTLSIGIKDDRKQNQSAAQYLQPTDREGGVQRKEIQPTTLSGILRKFGTNKIAAPVPGSRAGRQFIASNGNLKGKKVQSLISQLISPTPGSKEQYFLLTQRRGGLGPGIWRRYRVKNAVSLAFALLDEKPKQDTSIDINALLIKAAEERIPVLIEQKLRRLLR